MFRFVETRRRCHRVVGKTLIVELAQRVDQDLVQRGLYGPLILGGASFRKMRGMVAAKSVLEHTTPLMPAGVAPFQFGPTIM